MKRRKYICFIILFLSVLVCDLKAQTNYSAIADQAFSDMQYFSAIDKYKTALRKVKKNKAEKDRILFQIGECYRKMNDNKRAEESYKRLYLSNYQKTNPIILLYYADALKANNKHAEAGEIYKQYVDLNPNDIIGKYGIESCKLAVEWKNNPTPYEVKNEKKLNSDKDDWCPVYGDKKNKSIVFTSQRSGATGKGVDGWTGENFTDLFIVTNRKDNWNKPELFESEGIINTAANEGPATFTKNYNTLYFTRCGVEKKQRLGCEIYKTSRKGRGWEQPEAIRLGPDSFDFVHPVLSSDELTIYFVSNMPGGVGDLDIWTAKRSKKNGPFEDAVNLGPKINTPGKEAFLYLFADTVLFFSSKGLPGMGGYDIFKTVKTKGQWQTPENLQFPINSCSDDFGICFNDFPNNGYFTSNREGGEGGDDIYYFAKILPYFTLSGKISDAKTLKPITGVKVKLVGSDGTIVEKETDKAGNYNYDKTQILRNTSYQILATKDQYLNNSASISTIGLIWSKDFVADIILTPIEKKPIVLPEIRYDLAKWDLKPEYEDSLLGLIQTLQENPELVIELRSHTDARPIPMTNDTLSQKRAQSVVEYLITRGIDPNRLIAKGYAEKEPRRLEKDITLVYNGKTYTFYKDTVLSVSFINSLKSNEQKEAAHQLNRRTDFRILSNDFDPQKVQPKEPPKPKIQQQPQQQKPKAPSDNNVAETYTIQLGSGNVNPKAFIKLKGVKKCSDSDGNTIYSLGVYSNQSEADNAAKNVSKAGVKGIVISFDESQYTCEDLSASSPEPQQKQNQDNSQVGNGGMYTIQIGTGNVDKKAFSKLKGVKKCTGSDGISRYIIGEFSSKSDAENYNKNVTKLGYKGWVTEIDENKTNCEDL